MPAASFGARKTGASIEKSRLAGLIAHRHPDDPAITEARGDLTVAWIKRKLAAAPPLTEQQLSRIRAALPPAGGDHAAT